ncbi:MAG: hypothetical protein N3E40_07160 [Dehalococcoidia bacterium]|nr:hypothetical protein [Dehalococcoidia bacterium]
MGFLDPLWATRLLIVLGIINFVTGLLIFFSCRCLPGSRLGTRVAKQRAYQRFYKYHCYIWWVFWPSVMLHAILALLIFGWPG